VTLGKLVERDQVKRAQRQTVGANPSDYSEALERGLAVLGAFDAEHDRMTQADLAKRLHLPRATVRRSLTTLVHLGFLTVDGRTYRLRRECAISPRRT
jgi:IclR family pca regulon transcriptional regulator